MIREIKYELKVISNKCRFIEENINKVIDVKNVPKSKIIEILEDRKYDKLPLLNKIDESINENEDDGDVNVSFDYLLNMKI